MQKNRNILGYTLVELLIVIAIIGIMVTATIALINPAQQLRKSRDAIRKSDLKIMQSALEQYKADNNFYPAYGVIVNHNRASWGWAYLGSTILNSSVTYLNTVPIGPSGNVCTGGYIYATNEYQYTFFTRLENSADASVLAVKEVPLAPLGSSPDGYRTYTIGGGTCAGNTFNYWVNSP